MLKTSELELPVDARATEPRDTQLWEGVGRLVDRARSLADVRAHRLEALAAWRWHDQGRLVPADFAEHARSASFASLIAPLLLSHVRAAAEGEILMIKGPEAAARYPSPSMRPFGDLDLVVPDAPAVQRALVSAGFVLVGDDHLYRDIHHLQPLHLEGFPLVVEIHARPKWPEGIPHVALDELFDAAVDSVVPVDGISGLPAAQSALLLAAHAWAHVPLARIFHLVDVAAVRQDADPAEISALAARWGLGRLWRTTSDAADGLFYDRGSSWPLRSWARHLPRVRERTVLEDHLARWLACFSALPPAPALRTGLQAVVRDVRPAPDESWQDKWFRSRRAVANARSPRLQHVAQVEMELRRHRSAGEDSDRTPPEGRSS